MENKEDILKEFEKINATSKKINNTHYHVSIVEDQFGKEAILISSKKQFFKNTHLLKFNLFTNLIFIMHWLITKEDFADRMNSEYIYLIFPTFFWIMYFLSLLFRFKIHTCTVSKEKISYGTKPFSMLGEKILLTILTSNIQSIEVDYTGKNEKEGPEYGIYFLLKDKTKVMLFTNTNKLATDELSQIIRKFLDIPYKGNS